MKFSFAVLLLSFFLNSEMAAADYENFTWLPYLSTWELQDTNECTAHVLCSAIEAVICDSLGVTGINLDEAELFDWYDGY